MSPLAAPRSRARPSLLAGTVAALLLMLEAIKLAMLEGGGPAPVDGDAILYWRLGAQVARGDLWMIENPVGFRTPGYPWCLGAIQAVCGAASWRVVGVLQYGAVWIATLLTGWWVWQLSRQIWLVNAALALRCVSLAAPSFAGTILTESFYEPVFLGTLILLTGRSPKRVWLRWGLIGGLLALGTIIRPANAGIAPVVAAVALLESLPLATRGAQLRGLAFRLAIVGVMGGLIVGPWCVRNQQVFGKFSPSIFLGRELWMSVFGPGRPTGPALPETEEGNRVRNLLGDRVHGDDWRVNWTTSHALTGSGLSDAEADELMQRVAVQGFWTAPLRTTFRAIWRQIDFWRTTYDRKLYLYGDELTAESTPVGQTVWGTAEARSRRAEWLDRGLENRLLAIELGSLAGLVGAVGLLLLPGVWRAGVVVVLTLLVMDLLSGALDIPNYRLRMVLEPVLIVGGLVGWKCWAKVIGRGLRVSWQETSHVGA
ncbi:hypothetical protein [Planctellipticum variicoloris]|uniref:hypothetical protein n=1 Tax=Planctellipticum variicoloris TaxID=3064265 RepID=UPI00301395D0|nr:hypothetical protein SH412_003308 [Planctomycetaceae bacterium SH412]